MKAVLQQQQVLSLQVAQAFLCDQLPSSHLRAGIYEPAVYSCNRRLCCASGQQSSQAMQQLAYSLHAGASVDCKYPAEHCAAPEAALLALGLLPYVGVHCQIHKWSLHAWLNIGKADLCEKGASRKGTQAHADLVKCIAQLLKQPRQLCGICYTLPHAIVFKLCSRAQHTQT